MRRLKSLTLRKEEFGHASCDLTPKTAFAPETEAVTKEREEVNKERQRLKNLGLVVVVVLGVMAFTAAALPAAFL
jgi:hypothetical protein